MSAIWIILGVLAIAGFFLFLHFRQKWNVDRSLYRNISQAVRYTSPMGVTVYCHKELPESFLMAIDSGMAYAFRIAEMVPYEYHLKPNLLHGGIGFSRHKDYTVYVLDRSPKCQQAAFLMEYDGDQYDGTESDKDPRPGKVALCAAGAMLLTNGKPGFVMTDDLTTAAEVARFETEHNLLAEVDQVKFNQTAHHQNGGHPILPHPGLSGFLARVTEKSSGYKACCFDTEIEKGE